MKLKKFTSLSIHFNCIKTNPKWKRIQKHKNGQNKIPKIISTLDGWSSHVKGTYESECYFDPEYIEKKRQMRAKPFYFWLILVNFVANVFIAIDSWTIHLQQTFIEFSALTVGSNGRIFSWFVIFFLSFVSWLYVDIVYYTFILPDLLAFLCVFPFRRAPNSLFTRNFSLSCT